MGKLTWTRYGLVLLAGLAGFACSQEAREPLEVGTVQVEMRSDLIRSETPESSLVLSADKGPNNPVESVNPIPDTQRIVPSDLKNDSQDRSYRQEDEAPASSWAFADKHRLRGGEGFGVAGKGMTPVGAVHPDDALYYVPAVALKPYPKAPEHLEPMVEPFKSQKPLIFHRGATGFTHEVPPEVARSEEPTISEKQEYAKPKTRVIWSSANKRLDLMNGNPNLNRHLFFELP